MAKEGGYLLGFRVSGKVSHWLFVDDTIVFCETSRDQMVHLSWFLLWLEALVLKKSPRKECVDYNWKGRQCQRSWLKNWDVRWESIHLLIWGFYWALLLN